MAEVICQFQLTKVSVGVLPPWSPGSHIDVHVPGGLVRQYSLCGTLDDRYAIAVLRDTGARGGSIAMHDQAAVGTRLVISPPRNHFPLNPDAPHSLLFAGGIGITPILSMIDELHRTGQTFEMHYCARSRARMAYAERLTGPSCHLHFDDGDAAQRLDAATILASQPAGTHLYVCGPTGFMAHVLAAAEMAGWSQDRVHRECFTGTTANTGHGVSFQVQLASTGQTITVTEDQSVVAALATAGIDIPTACEQGVCGTCLTGILQGKPDHRDVYLTPSEQATNDQFTPCCSRAKSPLLVLDL